VCVCVRNEGMFFFENYEGMFLLVQNSPFPIRSVRERHHSIFSHKLHHNMKVIFKILFLEGSLVSICILLVLLTFWYSETKMHVR
jgi:hypothetical protein